MRSADPRHGKAIFSVLLALGMVGPAVLSEGAFAQERAGVGVALRMDGEEIYVGAETDLATGSGASKWRYWDGKVELRW